jgi:hypothetical protein
MTARCWTLQHTNLSDCAVIHVPLNRWRDETVYHDDMPYEIARPWASIARCNHGMDIQWRIPRITNLLLRTPWNP